MPFLEGDTSVELLLRARAGDRRALEELCARHLPSLRRWATGRLPRWARDIVDTDDLIQETLLGTIKHLGTFEPRHDGAFQAYLRQAVHNRIRNEIRRIQRRPREGEIHDREPALEQSPLEAAVGHEALERYEAALERLPEAEREAVVLKIEMGYSYERLAAALGKPTPDAARMAVGRALLRLAKEMGHGQ